MPRRALLGLILALATGLLAGSLRAQDLAEQLPVSTAPVRKAVIAVIDAQLKAFRTHNYVKAYSLAAPALRLQMPLDQFINIVKAGYPEVWSNQSATFGVVRNSDERATVAVKVKSSEGSASYDYILLKIADNWTVGGVLRHVVKPDMAL
jgi:hypothetical protein